MNNSQIILTESARKYVVSSLARIVKNDKSLIPSLVRATGFKFGDPDGTWGMEYRGISFGVSGYKEIPSGFTMIKLFKYDAIIHKNDLAFLRGKILELAWIVNVINGCEIKVLKAVKSV